MEQQKYTHRSNRQRRPALLAPTKALRCAAKLAAPLVPAPCPWSDPDAVRVNVGLLFRMNFAQCRRLCFTLLQGLLGFDLLRIVWLCFALGGGASVTCNGFWGRVMNKRTECLVCRVLRVADRIKRQDLTLEFLTSSKPNPMKTAQEAFVCSARCPGPMEPTKCNPNKFETISS